jgi:hypothetical protein
MSSEVQTSRCTIPKYATRLKAVASRRKAFGAALQLRFHAACNDEK